LAKKVYKDELIDALTDTWVIQELTKSFVVSLKSNHGIIVQNHPKEVEVSLNDAQKGQTWL